METFTALLRQIGQIFTWWFCVAPWEQAIRVRAGRHSRLLSAGMYLRIPFVDRVYVQSVRRRVSPLQMQTVSSKDGRVFTVNGSTQYTVTDIEKLYQALSHAEDTIRSVAMVWIATAIASLDAVDCVPDRIATLATDAVDSILRPCGIGDINVQITDFAQTRTYRLLMDQKWGTHGAVLDSEKAVD